MSNIFSPETTGQTQRRNSVKESTNAQQIDSVSQKRSNSKQSSRKTKPKVLFKMKFEHGDDTFPIVVREGDNPYTLAKNLVDQNGLDQG